MFKTFPLLIAYPGLFLTGKVTGRGKVKYPDILSFPSERMKSAISGDGIFTKALSILSIR
jgi:hypothetical protein